MNVGLLSCTLLPHPASTTARHSPPGFVGSGCRILYGSSVRADITRGRSVLESFPAPVEWSKNEPALDVWPLQDDSAVAPEKIRAVAAGKDKRNISKLFLLDVHPLCYDGHKPRPSALVEWIRLLFLQVTHGDPVIAVMDGERGNDFRKSLLPTYKEKRIKYKPLPAVRDHRCQPFDADIREALPLIKDFLTRCNVPVVKLEDAEADDVVATLTQQALDMGLKVAIASPDMDFRQLLSEEVQMVLPVPKLQRWSFYTLQQYVNQHNYAPTLELGLRSLMGDPSDNVPGLGDFDPQFGRKTAVKLMKQHGSLENLLVAASKRTVGKPYIQDALKAHAADLRRNLQVLSLRRDVDVKLDISWCVSRDSSNDQIALRGVRQRLQRLRRPDR